MASVTSLKDGRKLVQFDNHDDHRQTIRLGRTTMKDAESFGRNVEYLVSAKRMGRAVPNEIADWVEKLADSLADKLAGFGLLSKRVSQVGTVPPLGAFLDAFIESRSDSKPRTIINLKQTRNTLTTYFGDAKPLDEITPADGDDYRLDLLKRLGINTVRRHCGRCKQFFRYALRKRLIGENPFAEMKDCKVQANRERDYFVTHEDVDRLMGSADLEWKAILALCRHAGLRRAHGGIFRSWFVQPTGKFI